MGDLELRNQMIYEAHCAGKSLQDLAVNYNLTRQRISQIIASYQTPVPDDEARALERGRLEYVKQTLLHIVSAGPQPQFNVRGGINYDTNGEPVMDWQQVMQAADVYRKLSAEVRRMDALDKPRRKQMVEDEAMKQAVKFLRDLDTKMAQGEIIPGPSFPPST